MEPLYGESVIRLLQSRITSLNNSLLRERHLIEPTNQPNVDELDAKVREYTELYQKLCVVPNWYYLPAMNIYRYLAAHASIQELDMLSDAGMVIDVSTIGDASDVFKYMAIEKPTDTRVDVFRRLFPRLAACNTPVSSLVIPGILSVSEIERDIDSVYLWLQFFIDQDQQVDYVCADLHLLALIGHPRISHLLDKLFVRGQIWSPCYVRAIELLGSMTMLRGDIATAFHLWSYCFVCRQNVEIKAPSARICQAHRIPDNGEMLKKLESALGQRAKPHELMVLALELFEKGWRHLEITGFHGFYGFAEGTMGCAVDTIMRVVTSAKDCTEILLEISTWPNLHLETCHLPIRRFLDFVFETNMRPNIYDLTQQDIISTWVKLWDCYVRTGSMLRVVVIAKLCAKLNLRELDEAELDQFTLNALLYSLLLSYGEDEWNYETFVATVRTLLRKGGLIGISHDDFKRMLLYASFHKDHTLSRLLQDPAHQCHDPDSRQVGPLRCLAASVLARHPELVPPGFDLEVALFHGRVRMPLTEFLRAHQHYRRSSTDLLYNEP